MKRSIERIIGSYKMDPERKEIFVEGNHDRFFLEWLLDIDIKSDVKIYDRSHIDFETVDTNDKKIILHVASELEAYDNAIVFIDADYDRYLNESYPKNVITTDFRDKEGYSMNKVTLDKICALNLLSPQSFGAKIERNLNEIGRPLGILRILSLKEGFELPVNQLSGKLHRYIKTADHDLTFKFDKSIDFLINESEKVTQADKVEIIEKFKKLSEGLIDEPLKLLINGKDYINIMKEIYKSKNREKSNVDLIVNVLPNKLMIKTHENIGRLIQFINA